MEQEEIRREVGRNEKYGGTRSREEQEEIRREVGRTRSRENEK